MEYPGKSFGTLLRAVVGLIKLKARENVRIKKEYSSLYLKYFLIDERIF